MILKTSIILSFLLLGCVSKNIYKNTKLRTVPLEKNYVYTTRDTTKLDAGEDPIEFGGVLATQDTIYLTSETHGLQALDYPSYKQKWKFSVKNGISSEPYLHGDMIYFGANDGVFYALDREFGKVIWKHEPKSPIFSKPVVSGDKLLYTTADDTVYCLDAATGVWVWHYKRSGQYITTVHGNSTPLVHEELAYVGFSDGYLVALNFKDGNLRWERKIHKGAKFTDVDASPVVSGNNLFIASYDGSIYSLDTKSGKIIWYMDYGSAKKIIVEANQIYLASNNGLIYSLNKENGRVNWTFELDRGSPTGLVSNGNYLAFGSSQEYFYVIHKGDGSLAYRYDAGLRSGFVSTPFQLDKELFILSNFGNLYVFKWQKRTL